MGCPVTISCVLHFMYQIHISSQLVWVRDGTSTVIYIYFVIWYMDMKHQSGTPNCVSLQVTAKGPISYATRYCMKCTPPTDNCFSSYNSWCRWRQYSCQFPLLVPCLLLYDVGDCGSLFSVEVEGCCEVDVIGVKMDLLGLMGVM